MKKILSLIVAGTLLAMGAQAQTNNYQVGDIVDDFTVTDTHGNTHHLYELTAQGKYVYLDFFFTTCPPCQATGPTFNEFYDKYGCNSGNVHCLAIDRGDSDDAAVDAYENTYGGSFNHAPAVSNEGNSEAVKNNFGISAYPTYCLIGPDNKLKERDIYPINNVGTFEATFPSGFNPPVTACTAGLEEINTNISNVSVYPNPSNGNVSLNVSSINSGSITTEVTNLAGQIVKTEKFNVVSGNNSVQMDLSELTIGTYLVKVIEGSSVTTVKVQITK